MITSFTTIPLPIAARFNKSRQQDYQELQNCYIYISENGPTIHGFPGLKIFSAAATIGQERGSHIFNENMYVVSGTILEKITSDGVRTTIGTISGTGRCIFRDNGSSMFIVHDGIVNKVTSADVLSTVTGNFETPNGVAYLNNQFIYDGNGARFGVTSVTDPTEILAQNYAEAESSPDNLMRAYDYEQRLLMFGNRTIEPWYNSGEGSPPMERIDTGIMQVGLLALYSVASNTNYVYFLGHDCNVYQIRGMQEVNISNPAIAKDIHGFSTRDDAIGLCFNLEGQNFYYLAFPSEDKSYLYSEVTETWSTLAYSQTQERSLISTYQYCYGKHLVVGRITGDVFEFDFDTYTDNSQLIIRKITLPTVTSSWFKQPGRQIITDRFQIVLETGYGLAGDVQGSNPQIMLELSFDGGKSYSTIQNLSIGRAGEFTLKVEGFYSTSCYEVKPRITLSDPVFFDLKSASIDVQLGGW